MNAQVRPSPELNLTTQHRLQTFAASTSVGKEVESFAKSVIDSYAAMVTQYNSIADDPSRSAQERDFIKSKLVDDWMKKHAPIYDRQKATLAQHIERNDLVLNNLGERDSASVTSGG